MSLRRATAAAVLPYVERAARYDTTAGGETAAAVAARDAGYVLCREGRTVGAVTMQAHADELYITACAADREAGGAVSILRMIEARAVGFRSIAFQTRRRGLRRQAERAGYRVVDQLAEPQCGFIMRKQIK